jgi:hypothetical protein
MKYCKICGLPGATKCTQQANCLNVSMEAEQIDKMAISIENAIRTNFPGIKGLRVWPGAGSGRRRSHFISFDDDGIHKKEDITKLIEQLKNGK